MSDEAMDGLKFVPGANDLAGQGEKPQAAQPVPEGQSGTDDRPMTLREFQDWQRAFEDGQRRALQSQLDKRDHNLRTLLQERQQTAQQVAALAKQTGLSDEQVKSLQAAYVQESLQAALKDEPEAERPDDRAAAVTQQGETLAVRLGLAAGDPELATIKLNGTEADYLDSIVAAGLAKAARLAKAESQPQSAAAATLLAGGGRAADFTPLEKADPGALWRDALRALNK